MTRVAVIGAGRMGLNHLRVYSELAEAQLVGVMDSDEAEAQAAGRRFGVPAYADLERMLDREQPEAVTIAVPAVEHGRVALAVLQRGVHTLIEKPIAHTVADGTRIIHAAQASGARLMIGHIERFNPAVKALKERLARCELGRVFQMDARRQGPFSARMSAASVAIELAVHDLDVMSYLSGSVIGRVYAETERQIHGSSEDMLAGVVRFANGMVGTLTVNWMTAAQKRELFVIGEGGMYCVDYRAQALSCYENTAGVDGQQTAPGWRRESEAGQWAPLPVQPEEPLRAELSAFLAAVRGEAPIVISGHDGLQALAAAEGLVISGREQRAVTIAPVA